MERYFRLLKPDPSHRAFGYCSCKQDTKEEYWGQQFCQMERDVRSERRKLPDRSKWTTFKAGPEYSGRTEPEWSVPFDVSTEISGILGWVESVPSNLNCLTWMYHCILMNLSLSLRIVLFSLLLLSSRLSTVFLIDSDTSEQTPISEMFFPFFTRKTIRGKCLRSGAASCKRL